MEWIKRAWRGEEKLWKVFWIYGFVIPYAFVSIVVFISWHKFSYEEALKINKVINYSLNPYLFFWGICVWRCADNVKKKIWETLAIIVAFLSFATMLLEASNGASSLLISYFGANNP